MSTLSVPLTPQLEKMINRLVKSGFASNKATVVRKALNLLAEEEAIAVVRQSEQNFKDGKFFTGDLRKILKNLPD